ncbi:MAG: molecular chaperone TorD family protein [Deltaproteobacteria bacterium]|nr:molecular chaperone TorD family protein [Deltaproteobacteria bacterium]
MTATRPGFEAITEAEARQGLYSLASRVFLREVDLPFLQALRDGNIVGAFSERLLEGFEGRKDDEIIEELAVEFASCLLSSGAFLSPYESVQASTEGQLCGDASSRVLLFYKKSGFSMPEACSLFPDHFGIELEFMGHLCAMEASSLEKGDAEGAGHAKRLQSEFMKAHLGRWCRPFLQKVERAMVHAFYREIACFTGQFIDSELEWIFHESDAFSR